MCNYAHEINNMTREKIGSKSNLKLMSHKKDPSAKEGILTVIQKRWIYFDEEYLN